MFSGSTPKDVLFPSSMQMQVSVPVRSAMEVMEAVGPLGYDLKIRQINSGPMAGRVDACLSDGLIYVSIWSDCGLSFAGNRLSGYTPIAVTQEAAHDHYTEMIAQTVGGFFHGLQDLFFAQEPGATTQTVLIPTTRLLNLFEAMGQEQVLALMNASNDIQIPVGIAQQLTMMIRQRSRTPALHDSNDLIALVTECFSQRQGRTKPFSMTSRQHLAHDFARYTCSNLTETIGLEDMMAATNSGKTALCQAVRECFDVSPIEFYRQMRLEQVRYTLLHEEKQQEIGKSSVIQIAQHYGFKSRPQFAKRYAEAFGELPSETAGQLRFAA